jgi:hypothetical protein
MKEATIIKGSDLLMQIEHVHKAKAIVHEAQSMDLYHSNRGTLARFFPYKDGGSKNIQFNQGVELPGDVLEKILSETLRFISRVNRHLDSLEYDLKQELEDLQDEKA